MMNKEAYERLNMDVTQFDVEDIITTSGAGGDEPTTQPDRLSPYELPLDL